jgi:hypothetical protein
MEQVNDTHQGADGGALPPASLQLGDPLARQGLAMAKRHPPRPGVLNAIPLPLGADLRLKLRNRRQHVEEQPSGRCRGIDLLIEHLEVHAFALEFRGDLAQVQCGAGETIHAGLPQANQR